MSSRRHDDDLDDLNPADLMPIGSTGRNTHSDQIFANFESTLSGSKKRSRSDRDDDYYSKDKHSKDKRHKDKHHKHKDKHHKDKDKHKDGKKKPKFDEPVDDDAVHRLPSSSTPPEKLQPPILDETRRLTPHDTTLDLVNTDWMSAPPPPSSWRKQNPVTAPASAPKKSNLELNPQLNPDSAFQTDGTFKVGDGGSAWARSTGYTSSSSAISSTVSQLPSYSSTAAWKREEKPKQTEPAQEGLHARSSTDSHVPSHQTIERSADTRAKETEPKQTAHQVNSSVRPSVAAASSDEDLSTIDLNILKSQIMKAKLQKKLDVVQSLEAKLERARALQSSEPGESTQPSHVRVIDDLDQYGRSRSAVASVTKNLGDPRQAANPRSAGLHSKSGERLKYFADDDDVDLETMVARERIEKRGAGISSMDDHYAENVMRKRNYKEEDLFERHYDGDGDVDYGQWESKAKKLSNAELAQRARSSAIQASQKMDRATSNCFYCLKTKKVPAHLIISMGFHTTLMVPSRGHMLPGHCLIVPHEHYASCTTMEETVWEEMVKFMKALTETFAASKREPIFCETVLDFGPQRHTVVECFPIPKRDANMAPMFFTKAIKEFGGEFDTTHQRIHEFTLPKKNLRNTIPERFAYFMVQFGMDSGIAHHIEQRKEFPLNFGKSVIGGIMQLDETTYSGHAKRISYEEEMKIVTDFKHLWKPFDWTAALYQD